MIFTCQHKSVLDEVNSKGFAEAKFVSPSETYLSLLKMFNTKYNTNYNGLFFGVDLIFNKRLTSFKEYLSGLDAFGWASGTWRAGKDIVVLELVDREDTLPIDFYCFTDYMFFMQEGNEEEIKNCLGNLFKPNSRDGYQFRQVHLPIIKKEDIVQVHSSECFDITNEF